MSANNVPNSKPGIFGKIVKTVDGVLASGAAGLDALAECAASVVGKVLTAPERLLAEKAGEDIVDGLKADDVATAASVAAPPPPVDPAIAAASAASPPQAPTQ